MVKKLPTKAEMRAALEQETRRYLNQGGKVEEVPAGATGADPSKPRTFQSSRLFSEPRSERTFVPEVVAAIESRRSQMKRSRRSVPKRSRLPQPRRKTIYDDFGEPIRKVWIDD
ncbi:MAG: hypothetical protein V2I66_13505 [Halieaceae bacterium]|jgi:hypothetical protein|nr:hypothetical protein [Halieaceae bacterium]